MTLPDQPLTLEPEQYAMIMYFAPWKPPELRAAIDNDYDMVDGLIKTYDVGMLETFKVGIRNYAKRHPEDLALVRSDPEQAARNLLGWFKLINYRLDLVKEFERVPITPMAFMKQVGGPQIRESEEVKKSTTGRGIAWLARQLQRMYAWAFEGMEVK